MKKAQAVAIKERKLCGIGAGFSGMSVSCLDEKREETRGWLSQGDRTEPVWKWKDAIPRKMRRVFLGKETAPAASVVFGRPRG
jgi:hypothetical protein